MHWKDFNKITINGTTFLKEALLEMAKSNPLKETWEADFWNFLTHFMDASAYITVKSSGSTGSPKSITLSKNKMLLSAEMTCQYFNLKKGNKALLCLSTKHIGGMMMVVRAIYAELNLLITPPSSTPLESINEKIDFVAMVPFQVTQSLISHPKRMQKIEALIIGGGKINTDLRSKILALNLNAYSTFGMTETISHIALQKIGKSEAYHCLGNIEVKLSTKQTLEITAPNLIADNLVTNDVVNIINSKEFIWLGRADFAIETGGIKILPELVEQKLEPFISRRFIISSLPDSKLNNQVILIIEGKKMDLKANLFAVLEKYERPKQVYFVPIFAEAANNKLNRIKVREQVLNRKD